MAFENRRYQHPVGQGFFHSGLLLEQGNRRLAYAYDCGAMERYAQERNREIDRHIRHIGARSTLDLLFLSHIHADHVNGVERLLRPKNGLKVDTIVLPLTDPIERLIAFGRTAVEDGASAQSTFYRDFVLDPGAALARFGPRRIVFVEPGDRGDGAPDGLERPLDDPRYTALAEESWKFVGRGRVRSGSQIAGSTDTELSIIEDTVAIAPSCAQGAWLLAPFVDPWIAAHRSAFLAELAIQLGLARKRLVAWLAVTRNVHSLVTTQRDKLAAAYASITGDLNVTSLCLYSGPAPGRCQGMARNYTARFGLISNLDCAPDDRIAWLGTGDAALNKLQRRADFIKHYGRLLDQVVTLTLPHHGSRHNFDPQLLRSVGPAFCVAAADRYSTWQHPGATVVQAIASHPAVLQTVTSARSARAWEIARLS